MTAHLLPIQPLHIDHCILIAQNLYTRCTVSKQLQDFALNVGSNHFAVIRWSSVCAMCIRGVGGIDAACLAGDRRPVLGNSLPDQSAYHIGRCCATDCFLVCCVVGVLRLGSGVSGCVGVFVLYGVGVSYRCDWVPA